ncbi:MAG: hypothetical protein B7Y05_27420 [Polynucleobacter sp. 24-46-87]|nr:MAG: hypothetical protein B7Y05_27420 [Polynucleobacter sp. 24-46-87]
MGAGKSTVGKLLAKKLGRRFLDADHVIEERCGVKIPVIFEMEGEEGFRKREAQTIKDITAEQDIILATGGGAVLLPENRQYLRENVIETGKPSVNQLVTTLIMQLELSS